MFGIGKREALTVIVIILMGAGLATWAIVTVRG
jgi:hypothetical protein